MKGISLMILSASLCTGQVAAETTYCIGYVTHSYISASGSLNVRGDWRNDYTQVCNVNGDKQISAVTCSLWTSYIANSMTANKKVIFSYKNIDSCANIETYGSSPSPSYVLLVK